MSNQALSLKQRQHKIAVKIRRTISQPPLPQFLPPPPKPQYTDNIQNGLLVSLTHARQKTLTNNFSITLCINILMLYIYYELDFDGNEYADSWLLVTFLVHIACNVLYAMLLVVRYQNLNRIMKNDYSWWGDILKLIVYFGIHPFPGMNQATIQMAYEDYNYENMDIQIKVNYIILLVAIIRNIIMFLGKVIINSSFVGPRPNRIRKIYSVRSGSNLYAIRCIFREIPIKMFAAFFIIGLIYFSFSLQVTESNVPLPNNPFVYFQNCFWFVIITSTTVGFGDFKVFTHLGYLCSLGCMIWGSLCVSCILVILVNTLTLNSKEEASLTALKRVQNRLEYKQLCSTYIRVSLWRLWRNRKTRSTVPQSIGQRKLRVQLRQVRRQKNIALLAQRQFDNELINISYLLQNNRQLLSFIGNHIFSEQLYRQYGSTQKIEEKDEEREEREEEEYAGVSHRQAFPCKMGSSKHIKIKLLKRTSISSSKISEYSA